MLQANLSRAKLAPVSRVGAQVGSFSNPERNRRLRAEILESGKHYGVRREPRQRSHFAGHSVRHSRTVRERLVRPKKSDGAPARNQIAINVSKIMQPNEDVRMKGQIG